jgi:hypothetical protein
MKNKISAEQFAWPIWDRQPKILAKFAICIAPVVRCPPPYVSSCVAGRLQEKFVDTKRGNQKPEIEERQTTQW